MTLALNNTADWYKYNDSYKTQELQFHVKQIQMTNTGVLLDPNPPKNNKNLKQRRPFIVSSIIVIATSFSYQKEKVRTPSEVE